MEPGGAPQVAGCPKLPSVRCCMQEQLWDRHTGNSATAPAHLAIFCDAALQVVVQRVDVIVRRLKRIHQAVRAERAPAGAARGAGHCRVRPPSCPWRRWAAQRVQPHRVLQRSQSREFVSNCKHRGTGAHTDAPTCFPTPCTLGLPSAFAPLPSDHPSVAQQRFREDYRQLLFPISGRAACPVQRGVGALHWAQMASQDRQPLLTRVLHVGLCLPNTLGPAS